MTKSENLKLWHILMGQHSGFPNCCIEFFTDSWFDGEVYKDNSPHRCGVGYIPCPSCLETHNFVEVHSCDVSCISKLKEIGRQAGVSTRTLVHSLHLLQKNRI